MCHFYRNTLPCHVMDKHLAALARKHLETKFIKVHAEKAPFLTGAALSCSSCGQRLRLVRQPPSLVTGWPPRALRPPPAMGRMLQAALPCSEPPFGPPCRPAEDLDAAHGGHHQAREDDRLRGGSRRTGRRRRLQHWCGRAAPTWLRRFPAACWWLHVPGTLVDGRSLQGGSCGTAASRKQVLKQGWLSSPPLGRRAGRTAGGGRSNL